MAPPGFRGLASQSKQEQDDGKRRSSRGTSVTRVAKAGCYRRAKPDPPPPHCPQMPRGSDPTVHPGPSKDECWDLRAG